MVFNKVGKYPSIIEAGENILDIIGTRDDPYVTFNRLLRAAYESSNDVDNFDIRNKEGEQQFADLVQIDAMTKLATVEFIIGFKDELIKDLTPIADGDKDDGS